MRPSKRRDIVPTTEDMATRKTKKQLQLYLYHPSIWTSHHRSILQVLHERATMVLQLGLVLRWKRSHGCKMPCKKRSEHFASTTNTHTFTLTFYSSPRLVDKRCIYIWYLIRSKNLPTPQNFRKFEFSKKFRLQQFNGEGAGKVAQEIRQANSTISSSMRSTLCWGTNVEMDLKPSPWGAAQPLARLPHEQP